MVNRKTYISSKKIYKNIASLGPVICVDRFSPTIEKVLV